ncbi:hypothetical protein [Bradyrhizobium liaoningense]|uniref:hypothetical protein n=1 Tax=Bradyrhizobium liaoningense TaxID=43992 RepID=UPI001BAD1EC1|nr:hypothetical protein [Bradyrhizobium liaoningense]MBR0712095.1 hypothetical protein [Bradyrhizobium liaoningense]
MVQVMRLDDVVSRLSSLDSEATIYASEPWTPKSEAMVAREPDAGGTPSEALRAGLRYFLEISVAQDFVEDWLASLEQKPTPSEVCQRVIDYAINDA